MSELVLIANAGDGTVSALRLHREGTEGARLEPLATSPVGPGVGTFAIDTDRDLVYAAVKGDPAAIVTLRLDRETGALRAVLHGAVPTRVRTAATTAGWQWPRLAQPMPPRKSR